MINNHYMNPDQEAQEYLSKIGNTTLTPLEEVLFRTWMKANRVTERREKPDEIKPAVDWRGIYKDTGGKVFPGGELKKIAEEFAGREALLSTILSSQAEREEQEAQEMSKTPQGIE